jgi:hypothetical protein
MNSVPRKYLSGQEPSTRSEIVPESGSHSNGAQNFVYHVGFRLVDGLARLVTLVARTPNPHVGSTLSMVS